MLMLLFANFAVCLNDLIEWWYLYNYSLMPCPRIAETSLIKFLTVTVIFLETSHSALYLKGKNP